MFFQWAQLKHTIPVRLKKQFLNTVKHLKIITLSQGLEFCPSTDYPLSKCIQF